MNEEIMKEILKAAKEEFLSLGYIDASMRNIAKKANLTTGSLYYRFLDKSEMLDAVVGNEAEELLATFKQIQNDFAKKEIKRQINEMTTYTENGLHILLNYIYDHYDAFKIIVCKSKGSKYEFYLDSLVDVEVENTYRFINELKTKNIKVKEPSEDLIHILCTSFFASVFEVVHHDMKKEEALKYADEIYAFNQAGWSVLLGLDFKEGL